jgi:hypothetical protein
LENLTKVILVAYPDRFRLEEANSLVESLQNEIVKVYTQKYLDRAEFGISSGMAEAIKNFVKEYPADEIQQIVIDEHFTTESICGQTKSEFDFSFVCYDKTCPFVQFPKGPDYWSFQFLPLYP